MATLEYKLPGVYTTEIEGPRLSATSSTRPTVALVGPSIGYRTASQRITFSGTTAASFDNSGVIDGSYSVAGVSNGTTYAADTDYVVTRSSDGTATIKRKLTSLSTAKTTVSSLALTFYSATPSFSLMVTSSGASIDGYLVRGTVKCVGGSTTYVEGTDYTIDYHKGMFFVTSSTKITNATALTFSYDYTTAEPIELSGEAAYTLEHQYISKNGMTGSSSAYTAKIVCCAYTDASGAAHKYGDTPGATDGYVEGVDYNVDYDTGRISRTASSRIPTFDETLANYMYVEFAYCGIKDGQTCVVSYHYVDSNYYGAVWCDNYNVVQEHYGSAWNSGTGAIQSQLSVAAYIAAQNGLGGCYCVAVPGVYSGNSTTYTLSNWTSAFDALTIVDGVDIVVPLSGDASVWQLAISHINAMKENQDERVAIIGANGTTNVVASSTMIADAESLANEDVWMVSPSTFRMRNPVTNVVDVVAGYYAAAAVAGYESGTPQYTPLTQKVISGFYSANEYNTKATKTSQSANGLMYIDEVNGSMRILHGRSTSNASIISRETSIVLTKHYIIKLMRNTFKNGYIGNVLDSDQVIAVKSAAQSVLTNLQTNGYISAIGDLAVTQSTSDPTQLNVEFSYQPMYALNYIQISFAIDATSE